jgi:hypothetical protein
MNMPLALLNRRRRIGGFSPSALFALAEPGVWFDPSDVANLTWRRNLLTWTEQFDNAAWVKAAVSVSANAAVAPDGTTTADKLVEDTANSLHGTTVSNIFTATGSPYTYSVYVKQAERRYVLVAPTLTFNSTSASSIFDTQTGSWVLSGSLYSNHFAVSAGNGWWRIGFTNSVNDVSYDNIRIGLSSGATVADLTYTGDGTSGILVWGAQLELGSVATDYQRITDVNTEVVERFPNATLYQDTAGTTPVTTTGQSVVLMLDKSKGLVLGSELVTNGDFSGGSTGWTVPAGWSITGEAAVGAAVSASLFGGGVTPVAGRTYRVDFDVISYTSGSLFVTVGGNFSGNPSLTGAAMAPGRKSVYVVSGSSPSRGVEFYGGSVTATIDNISVKELPGNHAVQATAANRPIYGVHPFGGRRNLLNDTDKPTFITGTSVTANAAVGPSGQMTAARVSKNDATTPRYVRQNSTTFTVSASTAYVAYRFVKYDGFDTTVSVEFNGGTDFGTSWAATFNVTSTDVTLATQQSCTGSVVDFGSGWYRISAAFTSGTPTTPTNPSMLSRITGASGVSVLMTAAQLETGSTASAYQRVTDQYNVTEAGVASVSYLFFDGVNDSMSTSTITPGVDKAQVFAGVRKLSDAATGIFAELSANSFGTTNQGAFYLTVPHGTSASERYGFFGKGAVAAASGQVSTTSNGPAPDTAVITGLGDISGDLNTLRRNGVAGTNATADQGTGNYLAYPLFIGARNSASLFFSGHLYSLIARFGPNLATGQISSTETWVASRTGITI